ncbi:TetR/AcrR family transcriptional regulator [Ruicaihuangia caeni]|uniref:WHG domain-containing protein n=1 Tax=Ruicaihuangia caeni TaxID=3042517 RepID=A0AAW6TC63_9MICO|nr:TetR/AcrR family transcriptional regulator [Klugiella sp. YN-L-19]MDI2099593.1 WHG domain-containing protein [Klugiella sp. YN-L-19]
MPRAGLTRQRVVDAAQDLADELGLERITLAALAARLSVRVPSLYKHVDGLDALHRAIEAQAKGQLADALSASAVGVARGDALRALANAYRNWARRHPGRYSATLRAADADDAAAVDAGARAVEIVIGALSGYGLTGDDAIDAVRAVRASLHGFVALEAAGGFGMPHDVDRSFERLVAGLDDMLDQWGARASR